jgi:succinate dehydrogenase/fumarate reductase cytochrome b subunit
VQPAATGRLARWDRAFELTSVVPLGAFVVIHTLDYGRALFGAAEVGARRHPALPMLALEALLVWLPLAGHALYSFVVWRRRRATDASSAILLAHRIAGVVAGLFLVDHFVRFRLPILRGTVYPGDSVVRLAAELSSTRAGVPLVAALHLAGTVAVAFHLAMGLRRIVDRSERLRSSPIVEACCVGAGVVAGLLGVLTILRLAAGA